MSNLKNPAVPIRHMDFGFETVELKRYFYDDNAVATAFYLAFSAVIPQGERFFIHSVRHFRDQIKDSELDARVTGFIGQAAMHGKEHDAVNAAYEKMGYPISRIDRSVRDGLRWLSKTLPKPAQLAFTVALEHYTAIIAEDILEWVLSIWIPALRMLTWAARTSKATDPAMRSIGRVWFMPNFSAICA